METTTTTTPKPRNIFEQIALGLQTTNDNVVDIYKLVNDIHAALYPPTDITEPTDLGAVNKE